MENQFGTGRTETSRTSNQTVLILLAIIVGTTLIFGLGFLVGRLTLGPKPQAEQITTLPETEQQGAVDREQILQLQPEQPAEQAPAQEPPRQQTAANQDAAQNTPERETAPELRFSQVPEMPQAKQPQAAVEAARKARDAQEQKQQLIERAKSSVSRVEPEAQDSPANTQEAAASEDSPEQDPYLGSVPAGKYSVQVAAFKARERARSKVRELRDNNIEAYYVVADLGEKGIWYRVRIGEFDQRDDARNLIQAIKENDETFFGYAVEVE